jgi:hypothetical protein
MDACYIHHPPIGIIILISSLYGERCKDFLITRNIKNVIILWNIDPFLGNDRETNHKTTAVARQQVLNKQQLKLNNRELLEPVFSVFHVPIVATQWRGTHVSAATVE